MGPVARFLSGTLQKQLTPAELQALLLLRVADRVSEDVDEFGDRLKGSKPKAYNLEFICKEDGFSATRAEIISAILALQEKGFGKQARRGSVSFYLYEEGNEEALRLLDEASEEMHSDTIPQIGSYNLEYEPNEVNRLLVAAYFLQTHDGMFDFDEAAKHLPSPLSPSQVDRIMQRLESDDYIMRDTRPAGRKGENWAYFNTGGQERAKLLSELWKERPAVVPAADRMVRIDDNAPTYAQAVQELEAIVSELRENRSNSWEERDGYIAQLQSGLTMLRSKFVQKSAIKAVLYPALGFIAVKFAEQPIAEMAQKAWLAVKVLVGL